MVYAEAETKAGTIVSRTRKRRERAETDMLSNTTINQPLPIAVRSSNKEHLSLFRQLTGSKERNVVKKGQETKKKNRRWGKGGLAERHTYAYAYIHIHIFFAPSHKVPIAET